MEPPVDLANLRTMTDGDAEMEKELFGEFFISFEKGINTLRNSILPDAAESWRTAAHGLKGIALNLGAAALGNLCKKAQDEPDAGSAAKQGLLKTIETEYEQVKAYLKQIA